MKLLYTKIFICAFSSQWQTVYVIQCSTDLNSVGISRLWTLDLYTAIGNEKSGLCIPNETYICISLNLFVTPM